MDDLIYLILLIAWALFAFYRKSAKKKAEANYPSTRRQPGRESSPFPTFEEILLGRDPDPEPATVQPTYMTDGMAPELEETSFEREYNKQGISSIEEMDKPLQRTQYKPIEIHEEKVDPEYSDTTDYRSWIDLRQAVIYSEILNRPYV